MNWILNKQKKKFIENEDWIWLKSGAKQDKSWHKVVRNWRKLVHGVEA